MHASDSLLDPDGDRFRASGDNIYAIANLGDYNLSSGISTPAGFPVHIHGFNGRARLIFSSGGLRLQNGTADMLYVESNSAFTAFAVDTSTTSADRVFVKNASIGHACFMRGATLTNSVCWAGSSGDIAVETDGSNTLRNVTAVGGTRTALLAYGRSSGCSCTTATDTLVNVIARSGAGGRDLEANSDSTATININVSYSNYATTLKAGTGAPSMTLINAGPGNQAGSPSFVSAGTGDFHEASGSPTIDAGVNDPANGTQDLDGNARTLNLKTDIGAYELVPSMPPPKLLGLRRYLPGLHADSALYHALLDKINEAATALKLGHPGAACTALGELRTLAQDHADHLNPDGLRAFLEAIQDARAAIGC